MLVDIFINLNEQDEVKQISTHWNFTPINDIRDFFAELDNFLNNGRIVFFILLCYSQYDGQSHNTLLNSSCIINIFSFAFLSLGFCNLLLKGPDSI